MSKSRSVKALVRDICARPARGGKKAPTMKRQRPGSENPSIDATSLSPAICSVVAKMADQPKAGHNERLVTFCRKAREARQARAARFERMMAESGIPITLRHEVGATTELPKGLNKAEKRFVLFCRKLRGAI